MSALFPTMTGAATTTAVTGGKVAVDVVKDVARGSFDYVMDNKDNIANGVANGVGGLLSIGNAISETIRENEFNNPLFAHIGLVGSKVGQIVAAARQEGMENGVGEAGKNFFSSIRNTITNVVTQIVPEDVREKISNFVNKSKDKMSAEYGDEFAEVKDFVNDVRESVREKIDEIYVDKDAEPGYDPENDSPVEHDVDSESLGKEFEGEMESYGENLIPDHDDGHSNILPESYLEDEDDRGHADILPESHLEDEAFSELGDAIQEVEDNGGECFTENDDYDNIDHDSHECGPECVDYEDGTGEYFGPCH